MTRLSQQRYPAMKTAVLAVIWALGAGGLSAQPKLLEKAAFSAVTDRESYAPGSEVNLAVVVTVDSGWHVNSHAPTYDYLIPTTLDIETPDGWQEPDVVYPIGEMKTFAFAATPISVYDGQFLVRARLVAPPTESVGQHELKPSLRYQACDHRSCLPPVRVHMPLPLQIGEEGQAINPEYFEDVAALITRSGPAPPPGTATAPRRHGVITFLVLGVLGGLLLNAMPCVLPVLSLKLLGLVQSRGGGRKHVIAGSLATTAGILVSFWGLALAAVLARTAGATVGWGVQFQEPTFVVFLTVVVLLFCLNLWGIFEVPLPARLATWATASGGEGLPGHFTAGLFATLLATPCSAPFLGTAIGFALSQSTPTIFATFSAVGIGMALPYLLLAAAPGLVKILPKPGQWMDHFKFFMGFLLAAAAVWLLYVLSSQVSRERLAFIELALLTLSLFVWMLARSRRGSRWAVAAVLGVLISLAGSLALAATADSSQNTSASTTHRALIPWVPFDRTEAESLAAAGRLVFVDVTADWCFTCKVNERLALETSETAAAFERFDVVPMKADWTNRDDEIAAFLADHGKYGIPFYLLYRPGDDPYLFSELLTKDAVVSAVSAAAAGS